MPQSYYLRFGPKTTFEKKVYPEVPPKVEYRLTGPGADLKDVYISMGKWGLKHAKMLEGAKEKVSGQ